MLAGEYAGSGAGLAEELGHFGFGFLSSLVIRVSSFTL